MLALPFVGRITGYAINRREWNAPAEDTASTPDEWKP